MKYSVEEYREEFSAKNDLGIESMPFAMKIPGEIIAKTRATPAVPNDFQSRFRTKSNMKKMGAILNEMPMPKNRAPNNLNLSDFLIKANPKNTKLMESK